jgi:hypothetical protein
LWFNFGLCGKFYGVFGNLMFSGIFEDFWDFGKF